MHHKHILGNTNGDYRKPYSKKVVRNGLKWQTNKRKLCDEGTTRMMLCRDGQFGMGHGDDGMDWDKNKAKETDN